MDISNNKKVDHRTIQHFGEQWQHFTDSEGFFGSTELFHDIINPLMGVDELKGKRVLEIGSGAGRIVMMLLAAGAGHVIAEEPSDACDVLTENTKNFKDRVTVLKVKGDELPDMRDIDFAFSIGVLHHVTDPKPIVQAVYRVLKPGGKFFFWVYGKEGNEPYLFFTENLRKLTTHLPHTAVHWIARILNFFLDIYLWLCRYLKLPLYRYCNEVLRKFSSQKRCLVIYDQLRPAHAKYYSKKEAFDLMASGRFQDIQIHHRHKYSWSVLGTKPL